MLIRAQLVSIYMECVYESVSLFLTAMEKSYIPMVISVGLLPLHYMWCYLFVKMLGYGFIGVAYATFCTDTISLLAIYTVAKLINDEEIRASWVKFNFDVFVELRVFARLAFAGILIYCLEMWANEALQIISGLLDTVDQASMVVTCSLVGLIHSVPVSFGIAISTLTGA